nr:MAG TPA: hypothetical protein [Caudoviricetes sp.]
MKIISLYKLNKQVKRQSMKDIGCLILFLQLIIPIRLTSFYTMEL